MRWGLRDGKSPAGPLDTTPRPCYHVLHSSWIFRFMCLRIRFMSANGLSIRAACQSLSQGILGGQQVLCAHRPRARAGGALTHRCYTTVRSSTQSFTARHTSAWVIMGNVLQLSVFTSTRQLRWRRLDSEKSRNAVRCRSEHMTNTSVPTSTNTPSVAELQLDLYVFWRKYESCLLVVVFFY